MQPSRDFPASSLDEAVARSVDQLMAMAEEERVESPYQYPLAHPTYGAPEVADALLAMLRQKTSMWETTRNFERAFIESQFPDRPDLDAVMVNSGSSADLLCAFAARPESLDWMPSGSEVLVPAVTWSTHLWSVIMAGYKPILVDVDPKTFNLDFRDAARKMSSKTRGIFLVHLMGFPVDMDRATKFAEDHKLCLLEDCCESLGASWGGRKVGQFGRASSFSFFFSHHITTMEGGMVVADRDAISEFRLLRAHGWSRDVSRPGVGKFVSVDGIDPRYRFESWGFNVRPTELNAAFGIRQLERLDGLNRKRMENYLLIRSAVSEHCPGLEFPEVDAMGEPNPFAIAFLSPPGWRNVFQEALEGEGVETRSLVAGNLARHPAVKKFGLVPSALPGADRLHFDGIYIGLHSSEDSGSKAIRAAECIISAYKKADQLLK